MGLDLNEVAIGFTGTGGSGKTTTARALAHKLELPFRASVSRDVFEKWHITEADQRDMTPEENLDLQLEIFDSRKDQIEKYPYGVYDRTLLDHLVYTLYRCGPVVDSDLFTKLCKDVAQDVTRHELILFTPIVQFSEDDAFREQGFGYRLTIDLMNRSLTGFIDEILNQRSVTFTLPVMSVEKRVDKIITLLDDISIF